MKRARMLLPLVLLLVLGVLSYRPDRPVPVIVPGSSDGPAFVVQVIRPRASLPLGGILPPQLFGLDAHLGFDSASPGASIEVTSREQWLAAPEVGDPRLDGDVDGQLRFAADGWELLLRWDDRRGVSPETVLTFELVFEEQPRRVRCRPGPSSVATLEVTPLGDGGEFSGTFDIELSRCEDAETGAPLGWPPQPFVLHGSFDRLVVPGAGPR